MSDNDQGLVFLRKVISLCLKAENTDVIMVTEHGERYAYDGSPEGVKKAAQWAADVDGVVRYTIGKAVALVLFDGPYCRENRAEIIMDSNERYAEIVGELE